MGEAWDVVEGLFPGRDPTQRAVREVCLHPRAWAVGGGTTRHCPGVCVGMNRSHH